MDVSVNVPHTPVRYGSGNYEDPPETQNDVEQDTFYVEYGSTTERGVFNSGGSGYPSLADAMAQAESVPDIGSTIRWKDNVGNA